MNQKFKISIGVILLITIIAMLTYKIFSESKEKKYEVDLDKLEKHTLKNYKFCSSHT